MKNILLTSLILVFVTGTSIVTAVAQLPKTITDFYMALPDSRSSATGEWHFFHPPDGVHGQAAIAKYRRSLIKIEDIKNGYLKLEGQAWEGWVEMALFKKTDGSYIVAISEVGCGPGCSSELELVELENGAWKSVTNQYFPAFTAKEEALRAEGSYFQLPRVGRTVKMVSGSDDDSESQKSPEFAWEWNGQKFMRR